MVVKEQLVARLEMYKEHKPELIEAAVCLAERITGRLEKPG